MKWERSGTFLILRNAAISDKILILMNGAIEAAGNHSELLKSENYYRIRGTNSYLLKINFPTRRLFLTV